MDTQAAFSQAVLEICNAESVLETSWPSVLWLMTEMECDLIHF